LSEDELNLVVRVEHLMIDVSPDSLATYSNDLLHVWTGRVSRGKVTDKKSPSLGYDAQGHHRPDQGREGRLTRREFGRYLVTTEAMVAPLARLEMGQSRPT
jgi:hypothetical protein